jgi:hypothetical protein
MVSSGGGWAFPDHLDGLTGLREFGPFRRAELLRPSRLSICRKCLSRT